MTLRHRLLLVYLIVVLLSVATVGVAVFELEHARQIYGALQPWNDMALAAQKLRSAFSPPGGPATEPEWVEFKTILVDQYPKLAEAGNYRNADQAREALNTVNRGFQHWTAMPADIRVQEVPIVRQTLLRYAQLVEDELDQLKGEARLQETRKLILLIVVAALTVLHVAVIGSLLRRWLIRPMERLDRQVDALARDQPPTEPLLTTPREMANLAEALDRARQSLGSLRQRLIEAERLTTIGQLAAQLAHNLRNPLATIRATAQLAARHQHQDADTRHRMDEIIGSVDRMNRWIAGLMEAAQERPTSVSETDVVPTLRRVREALVPELAAKDLELVLDVPPEGLVCAHDPATLEHALVAMIVNAIEASPLGEKVFLRAERMAVEPVPGQQADFRQQPPKDQSKAQAGGLSTPPGEPSSLTASPRECCRISVQDRGCGLPPEAPGRIFEFSYSTKQRGMGLGLALAQQALQRQGGTARARNNPDGGATVYVELPLRQGERIAR